MKKKIELGISLMPEGAFLQAVLPLFASGDVDVVEWSFDTFPKYERVPDWIKGMLQEFGDAGKLLGHGVYYSVFNALWSEQQQAWLDRAKLATQQHSYTHISEHFGFMSSDNYHASFPLPISLSKVALEVGKDRLKRLADAVQLPVGIENLAFSFSKKDVFEQGVFIDKLLEVVDGFILLDLHNIYCQAHNFGVEILELVELYPLEKVKEIHLSGGSWQESIYRKEQVRRDTHDGKVPKILMDVLPKVLAKCPHVEFVILERLGHTFSSPESVKQYQNDFYQIKSIIDNTPERIVGNWGKPFEFETEPVNSKSLYQEQILLAQMLKTNSVADIKKSNRFEYWNVSDWDVAMVDTAKQISDKWSD